MGGHIEKPITTTKKPKILKAPQKVDKLKKLELKEKELDLKSKELDLKGKALDLKEREKKLGAEDERLKNETDGLRVSKLDTLRWLLTSWDIDEEQTQVGSELKFKNTFDSEDREMPKVKIYNILNKL